MKVICLTRLLSLLSNHPPIMSLNLRENITCSTSSKCQSLTFPAYSQPILSFICPPTLSIYPIHSTSVYNINITYIFTPFSAPPSLLSLPSPPSSHTTHTYPLSPPYTPPVGLLGPFRCHPSPPLLLLSTTHVCYMQGME